MRCILHNLARIEDYNRLETLCIVIALGAVGSVLVVGALHALRSPVVSCPVYPLC